MPASQMITQVCSRQSNQFRSQFHIVFTRSDRKEQNGTQQHRCSTSLVYPAGPEPKRKGLPNFSSLSAGGASQVSPVPSFPRNPACSPKPSILSILCFHTLTNCFFR